MRLWINAANAVLVTSDYEGLGMICIEALACLVPVLSTPVGIAPFLLDGVDGVLCADYEPAGWKAAVHAASGVRRPEGQGRRAGGVALLGPDRGAHDRGLPRRSGRLVIDFVLRWR